MAALRKTEQLRAAAGERRGFSVGRYFSPPGVPRLIGGTALPETQAKHSCSIPPSPRAGSHSHHAAELSPRQHVQGKGQAEDKRSSAPPAEETRGKG